VHGGVAGCLGGDDPPCPAFRRAGPRRDEGGLENRIPARAALTGRVGRPSGEARFMQACRGASAPVWLCQGCHRIQDGDCRLPASSGAQGEPRDGLFRELRDRPGGSASGEPVRTSGPGHGAGPPRPEAQGLTGGARNMITTITLPSPTTARFSHIGRPSHLTSRLLRSDEGTEGGKC
jgi:hypothetical protein